MGYEAAIIAKLRSQGCVLDEAGCTPASLAFKKGEHTFFIPREPVSGYTQIHLVFIEAEMDYLEIELLPLDPWLH